MHNKVRKLVKNILMVSIVCAFLVGCGASETESNTEGQSALNNVSENLSENIETENKTTSKQETTTEPTTEAIPDDGQRDKLVAAAKVARDEYVASYEEEYGMELWNECAGFYDFNLDGVPEFCTLEPNATGILSGYAYVYVDGQYVKQHNIYSYNQMETYKNAEGNCRTVETRYRYTMNENSEDITEYTVYVYDYNKNQTEQVGIYTEKMETKEKEYYNNNNEKITKEQYDEILNGYLEGYSKVDKCGGKYESIGADVEESLFDAYVSYLKR